MITLTRLKLVLTVLALAVFGVGIRMDEPRLRLVSIGLLAVAFLLRFVKRNPSGSTE